MVTELITEKSNHIRNWMWRQRLERAYSAHAGLIGDGRQLHFVLGVMGGGADHLARLIAHPGSGLRLFNNVLARFEPRLMLSNSGDRLALPFTKELPRDHPLLRTLRMLVEYDNVWATLRTSNRIQTDRPEEYPALIKENHALLAAEALLRDLGCKIMFYVGDPVKIVDNLLDEHGLETAYLTDEGRSVLAPFFLGRFLRRDYSRVMHAYRKIRRLADLRMRIILHRIMVVALIHHMFRMLAARYPQQAVLVENERIVEDPASLEQQVEALLGEDGIGIGRAITESATFRANGDERLLWRNAWPEQAPALKCLSAEEVREGYRMLHDSGLLIRRDEHRRGVFTVAGLAESSR